MLRRLLPLLLLALIAAGASAAPASAKQNDIERGRAEIGRASAKVDDALQAVKDGDRAGAYKLARSAYLDHYEFVEVPMRLRDPNKVLDTEFKFAEMRNDIRDGAPLSEIRRDVADVRAGLVDSDRVLAEKGVAAPAVAFGFSFAILFREGIEAVLLIAILLGSLSAGRAQSYKRPLGWGVAAAVAATGVTWLLATLVIEIAPVNREILEAVTALLAVVVLVVVSFWLIARLEHKRRQEFMRARVASAMAAGTTLAFVGLGFTAVYREGFETVLFYQALALFAEGLGLWVWLGAITAAAALGAAGYAILRMGKQLPLKPMLVAGASILLLLSVAFAGNALRSLQSADIVHATPVASPRLPVFLAELTGIHPTKEGLYVQGAMILVFALGALWVFGIEPARRRRRVQETETAAA
jgi:high-affinity iron transporter